MKEELQLNLQAHLDGELSSGEARETAALLERDAEARALLAELKNTRGSLAGFETDIKLPESREFYWSKIEREIRRLDRPETEAAPFSILAVLRRLLVPAVAVVALLIAVSLIGPQAGLMKSSGAPELETALADSDSFTFRDYKGGTTLIWLSYPAENEFAQLDTEDILD